MQEIYKDKLSQAVNDDLLIRCFRALFDERIEKEMPKSTDNNDDAVLGAKFRAYEKAKEIITKTFEDLNNYKTNHTPSKKFNRGK